MNRVHPNSENSVHKNHVPEISEPLETAAVEAAVAGGSVGNRKYSGIQHSKKRSDASVLLTERLLSGYGLSARKEENSTVRKTALPVAVMRHQVRQSRKDLRFL